MEDLQEFVDKLNEQNLTGHAVTNALQAFNDINECYGIEVIRNYNLWDNFAGEIELEYANAGDSYHPTLMYSWAEKKFYGLCIADWTMLHSLERE